MHGDFAATAQQKLRAELLGDLMPRARHSLAVGDVCQRQERQYAVELGIGQTRSRGQRIATRWLWLVLGYLVVQLPPVTSLAIRCGRRNTLVSCRCRHRRGCRVRLLRAHRSPAPLMPSIVWCCAAAAAEAASECAEERADLERVGTDALGGILKACYGDERGVMEAKA